MALGFLVFLYPIVTFSIQIANSAATVFLLIALPELDRARAWVLETWGLRRLRVLAGVALTVNAFSTPAAIIFASKDLLFLEPSVVRCLQWLAEHGEGDAVVMSSSKIGNIVPVYGDQRAFCGYNFSTVNYEGKSGEVQQFYSSETTDDWRVQFLRRYGIRYVLCSVYERHVGSWYPDGQAERWLKSIWADGQQTTLYEMNDPSALFRTPPRDRFGSP